MFYYYVSITRNGQQFYVTSPHYKVYELEEGDWNKKLNQGKTGQRPAYLWMTEEDCKKETRWRDLLQDGDEVSYIRTYRS